MAGCGCWSLSVPGGSSAVDPRKDLVIRGSLPRTYWRAESGGGIAGKLTAAVMVLLRSRLKAAESCHGVDEYDGGDSNSVDL